jgi:hypothetical protein
MIAITVQMETQFEFTEEHQIVRNVRSNDNYEPMSDFFQQCIDQKWVLNTCKHTYSDDVSYTTTTYFAVDHVQADKFITAFSDMSVEFSIKKFWSELSHQVTVTKTEIDFNLEQDLLPLIDREQKTIWGISFPSESHIRLIE